MPEATSIINGITDGKENFIDLTVGRTRYYPSDETIDNTIVIEELAETFHAS